MRSNTILYFLAIPIALIVIYIVTVLVQQLSSGRTSGAIVELLFDQDRAVQNRYDQLEINSTAVSPVDADKSQDPVVTQLMLDSHTAAMKTWCETKGEGYRYDFNTNTCRIATKELCEKSSVNVVDYKNIFDPVKETPFLIWSNNQCVLSRGNYNACFEQCTMREAVCNDTVPKSDPTYLAPAVECDPTLTRDDPQQPNNCNKCFIKSDQDCTNLTYVPPQITCDDFGVCTQDVPSEYPRCVLTNNYCTDKGLAYDPDPSTVSGVVLGSCYGTDVQSISEMILGKTITRSIKTSTQAATTACSAYGSENKECSDSILLIEVLPFTVLWDITAKHVMEGVSSFERECGFTPDPGQVATIDSPAQLYSCIQSAAELFPLYWVTKEVSNLINSMFSKVLGMPSVVDIDVLFCQAIITGVSECIQAVYLGGKGFILDGFITARSKATEAYNIILANADPPGPLTKLQAALEAGAQFVCAWSGAGVSVFD